MSSEARPLYGLIAEFGSPDELVSAVRHVRASGLRRVEAYTPIPIKALNELLVGRDNLLAVLIFGFGLVGLILGFFIQYYGAAVDYPINVGGRPLNSWPAFTVIAVEIALLWTVGGAFILFFLFSRMPKLRAPMDTVPGFGEASRDRFFLCVEADDPSFDYQRARDALERCGPANVWDVPA